MTRRTAVFAMFATTLYSTFAGAQGAPVDDGHGKEWRQLADTTGLSWSMVAEVCPRDGLSACSGAAGGVDLTGWVWATEAEAIELLSNYTPDILGSTTVTGSPYFFPGLAFFGDFRPTDTIFITYFSFELGSGWTASTNDAGLPVVGGVSVVIQAGFPAGTFTREPAIGPDLVDSSIGVFLFRPIGIGTNAIIANDDLGQVASPSGGTAIASVLGNDWLAGQPATMPMVTVSQDSSTSDGVTINPGNGAVLVAPGTVPGTHVLVYRICEAAVPDNCATANARIVVPPYALDAESDQGSISPSTGGIAIANVLANDMLAGVPASAANVILSQVSSTSAGIALLSDGSVEVARGTPFGDHSLVYQICETANPSNCAQATAMVTVAPNRMAAVDDSVRSSSKKAGTAIASVLANDWMGNAPATTENVSLSLLSLTPANQDIQLDPATGAVDILRRTQSGTYALAYRICELAAPDNCADGTVTLNLSGK